MVRDDGDPEDLVSSHVRGRWLAWTDLRQGFRLVKFAALKYVVHLPIARCVIQAAVKEKDVACVERRLKKR